MKEIEYPLELFHWNLHDNEGNVKLEVRDVKRKTIFFIGLRGHEYNETKWFIEEMAPLVVKLLNDHAVIMSVPVAAPPAPIPVDPIHTGHSNGKVSIEKKVSNPWGRKGRPKNG